MLFHKFARAVVLLLAITLAQSAKAGTLNASFATVPEGSDVSLSQEGKVDWVHWGLHTESSLNRKAGVTPQISDFTRLDASNGFSYIYQYADNFNGYSWNDGFPETSVANTPTGVWAYGVPTIGSGFQIQVPADTSVRIAKFYVGWFAGVGAFEAHLSDHSAPAYSNISSQNIRNGPGRVYTIEYSADSPGQQLIVRWTLLSPRDATANVTLQAAALTAPDANNPPWATLTDPADNSNLAAGAPVALNVTASDLDGSVARVEFYDGVMKIGEDTTMPFAHSWTGATAGHHILRVRAVDDAGGSRFSSPVDVFVHGSGGTLNGNTAFPASYVSLTSEGVADWIHWGLTASNLVNRKTGPGAQISAVSLLGTNSAVRYSNNYTSFAWSDGAPVLSESGTPTGIFLTGITNGFGITAPADSTLRTLKVYVGLYGAQGTFQAFLSDGSAPAYSDTSLNDIFSDRYAVYTLEYSAASAAQTLTVQYRASRLYDMDYGNVTLQAATLQGPLAPLPLRILSPRHVGSSFAFDFNTETGRTYTVEHSPQLPSTTWATLATVVGDGNVATVTDPNSASSNQFYRVRSP
jgi:hypothetical protein